MHGKIVPSWIIAKSNFFLQNFNIHSYLMKKNTKFKILANKSLMLVYHYHFLYVLSLFASGSVWGLRSLERLVHLYCRFPAKVCPGPLLWRFPAEVGPGPLFCRFPAEVGPGSLFWWFPAVVGPGPLFWAFSPEVGPGPQFWWFPAEVSTGPCSSGIQQR